MSHSYALSPPELIHFASSPYVPMRTLRIPPRIDPLHLFVLLPPRPAPHSSRADPRVHRSGDPRVHRSGDPRVPRPGGATPGERVGSRSRAGGQQSLAPRRPRAGYRGGEGHQINQKRKGVQSVASYSARQASSPPAGYSARQATRLTRASSPPAGYSARQASRLARLLVT